MLDCNSGNNNQYLNYPPIMNDSRYITDFNSSIVNDNRIKSDNKIQNNTEYRHYLQKNADTIIKNNQNNACNNCNVCYYNHDVSEKKYILKNESLIKNDVSDLKTIYLSKFDLNSQIYTPTIELK
tara:strand:+ start:53 stop:427 length:375 start_codon:yes stop_codon:yes gene_type:complete